ncbi:MAG: tetratricopeptide repeat protein [Candidatus Hodarchaeota archaeon]
MSYDELPAEVTDTDARSYWEAYDLLKNNENYEEVDEILEKLCKKYPDIAKFRFNHALVLYNLERLKDAVIELDAALELKPDDRKGHNFRKFLVSKLEAQGIDISRIYDDLKATTAAEEMTRDESDLQETIEEKKESLVEATPSSSPNETKPLPDESSNQVLVKASAVADAGGSMAVLTEEKPATETTPEARPREEVPAETKPLEHAGGDVSEEFTGQRLTDLKSLIGSTRTSTPDGVKSTRKEELITFTNMSELEKYKSSIKKFNEKFLDKKFEDEIVEDAWAPDDIIVIEDEYEFMDEEPLIEVVKRNDVITEEFKQVEPVERLEPVEQEEMASEDVTPGLDEEPELAGEFVEKDEIQEEERIESAHGARVGDETEKEGIVAETIHDIVKSMDTLGLNVVNVFRYLEPISSILEQECPNKTYCSFIDLQEHVRLLQERYQVDSSAPASVYKDAKRDMKELLGNLKLIELEKKFSEAVKNFKKNQFYTINDPYLILFMGSNNPVINYQDIKALLPSKLLDKQQSSLGEVISEEKPITTEIEDKLETPAPSISVVPVTTPGELAGEESTDEIPEETITTTEEPAEPLAPAPPRVPTTEQKDKQRPRSSKEEIDAMLEDIIIIQKQGEGIEDYMAQLAYYKENLTKFKRIARQLYNNAEYDNALRLYNKLMECLPEDLEVLFNLSFCYRELENFDESIDYLKRILEYYYDNAYGWYCLANVYFMIEDRPKELYSLKKAREFGYFVNLDRLSRLAVTYQEQNPFEF